MLVRARYPTNEKVSCLIDRFLPVKGRILVKRRDLVKPETVIGVCQPAPGFRTYNLAHMLGVAPDRAADCLLRPVGSQVYRGSVIARRKSLLGLKTLEFTSPIDGVLYHYSKETGLLTLQYASHQMKLIAGVEGVVEKVMPGRWVQIKALVSKVQGVIAAGNDREGIIKIISNPDIAISPQAVTGSCQGKILAGGALLSKEVIYKCLAVKVKGVICGGMHWRDFNEIVTPARGRSEDVGLTVLLTEGFGYQPMNRTIFDLLSRYENWFGMILSNSGICVIPLSGRTTGEREEAGREKFVELKKHLNVRLINPPRLDVFGTISKLGGKETRMQLGIRTPVAEVKVGDRLEIVPTRNLEAIVG
ncbi:hypothetical protein B5M47_02080 [candidate division CPR3 bacterium 4484_211]|uniref:KOW domain-containing protein n=1 Tax=candidate division CPR3 bacterium 4484_211 TaxID=1968527 RepID=A0A1W9NY23_UNCC3|nr:MAG: hypothetical protein B5M47_02080 [candidate division CPR3 bacterium 4484_211]